MNAKACLCPKPPWERVIIGQRRISLSLLQKVTKFYIQNAEESIMVTPKVSFNTHDSCSARLPTQGMMHPRWSLKRPPETKTVWYNNTKLRGTNRIFVKLGWFALSRTTLTAASTESTATVGYHIRFQPETYLLRFRLAISECRFLVGLREVTVIHLQTNVTLQKDTDMWQQKSLWSVTALDK